MRARWLLLVGITFCPVVSGALYKHVDESGSVTYSDRPRWPGEQALHLPPPNVATPEARRQLELARQAFEREERAEQEAQLRRAAAVRAAPSAHSRPARPMAPRYASTYLPYSYPAFTVFTAVSRPAPAPRRAHR
jgi:hypothetical protein